MSYEYSEDGLIEEAAQDMLEELGKSLLDLRSQRVSKVNNILKEGYVYNQYRHYPLEE